MRALKTRRDMRRLSNVKRISEQDRQFLAKLKEVVISQLPDARVALYGSAARGTAKPDSDYDVLVLTRHKLTSAEERKLDRAVYDLQLESEVVLSVIIYRDEQWRSPAFRPSPYRNNVIREGIIL